MSKIDWGLLLPALFLVVLSLSAFYSIDRNLFTQQAVFCVVALAIFVIIIHLPLEIYLYYSRFFYIVMICFLAVLFIIGIEARGSTRWIDIFGVRLQFSEILKPVFILYFTSWVLAQKKSVTSFLKGYLLFFPIFFLIMKQPDLGSALIYLFAVTPMFLVAGFSFLYFVVFGFLAAIPMPFLFNLLHDYQKQRVYSFFNYTSDPFGSSYNAVQSIISVGSGGIMGKGFGQATQSILRFLPERHTDFIFATISETLGLVGGAFILVCYIFLLHKIYKIAINASDQFIFIASIGFFFLFLTHVFFNIGMNIGILPIVGITLPFVSYGGSSLVANFIILGILNSFSQKQKRHNSLEIR